MALWAASCACFVGLYLAGGCREPSCWLPFTVKLWSAWKDDVLYGACDDSGCLCFAWAQVTTLVWICSVWSGSWALA